MTSERLREPLEVAGSEKMSTGNWYCGCLKTPTDRLRGRNVGRNHLAAGAALMQKEVFTIRPTHALLPPHTPQSSTTLPLPNNHETIISHHARHSVAAKGPIYLLGTPSQPLQEDPLPPQTPHASTEMEAFNDRATASLTRWKGCWLSKYTLTSNTLPVFAAAKDCQSGLRVGDETDWMPVTPDEGSGEEKRSWGEGSRGIDTTMYARMPGIRGQEAKIQKEKDDMGRRRR